MYVVLHRIREMNPTLLSGVSHVLTETIRTSLERGRRKKSLPNKEKEARPSENGEQNEIVTMAHIFECRLA
jgi:hypothetical protein